MEMERYRDYADCGFNHRRDGHVSALSPPGDFCDRGTLFDCGNDVDFGSGGENFARSLPCGDYDSVGSGNFPHADVLYRVEKS